jgi:prepilin-type N-terminal cleavage/methylation domain-containing protein
MYKILKKQNKSGFTLIEIVVVLIILGVLAAIALPMFFTWFDRSHEAEGVISAGVLADEMDGCLAKGGLISDCVGQLIPGSTGCQVVSGSGSVGVFVSCATGGSLSPYFEYGIIFNTINYYMIVANWDTTANPRSNLSSQSISCANSSNLSTTISNAYGIIGMCSSPVSARTIVGTGIFQGM